MRHKPEPYDNPSGGKGTEYCSVCGANRAMRGNRPAGEWRLNGQRSLSCLGHLQERAEADQTGPVTEGKAGENEQGHHRPAL